MQIQLLQPPWGAETSATPAPKREQKFVFGKTVAYIVVGLGIVYLAWFLPKAFKEIR